VFTEGLKSPGKHSHRLLIPDRLVTSLPTVFLQGELVAVGRLVLLGAAKRAVVEFEIQVTF
jgi:hypothetical protein